MSDSCHNGAGYDPSSPAFVADPYPVFERLRAERPVFFHEPTDQWVISRLAGDLAGALAATGGGDVIAEVAEPLPVNVIAEMLGVPSEDRRLLRPWSADICGMYELNPSPDAQRTAVRAAVEFSDYLR